MAVDLYKDDFSHLADADVFKAIEAFTRISEPLAVRPRESFVLDFKEDWSEGALHTVDGFAHTFGGLLIVGVSENSGQPDTIVGVESSGELKTRIASSIATNISPTPPYEIAECNHPMQPGRKLAVVRVRASHQIHYCTKKGSRPIYVRNEDQSPPADAAQLRSLIERRASEPMGQTGAAERMNVLRPGVNLRRTIALNKNAGIPTTLQILVVPFEHPGITLDVSVEQQFRNLVNAYFSFRYRDSKVEREEERWVDYYDWRWFRASDTHESVWRITSSGDLVYARQARVQVRNSNTPVWSLGDTIADLLVFLAVVRAMWKSSSYYGEGHVLVGLGTHELPLHTELVTEIRRPSDPGVWYAMQDFNSALRDSVISPAVQTTGAASATAIFNSGLPYDAISDTVAHLLNQLLRSLTYAADLSTLRRAVECFFQLAKA
jgi:hypothetical protein